MGWLVLSWAGTPCPGSGSATDEGHPWADVHTWDSQSPEDIHAEGTAGIRPA